MANQFDPITRQNGGEHCSSFGIGQIAADTVARPTAKREECTGLLSGTRNWQVVSHWIESKRFRPISCIVVYRPCRNLYCHFHGYGDARFGQAHLLQLVVQFSGHEGDDRWVKTQRFIPNSIQKFATIIIKVAVILRFGVLFQNVFSQLSLNILVFGKQIKRIGQRSGRCFESSNQNGDCITYSCMELKNSF